MSQLNALHTRLNWGAQACFEEGMYGLLVDQGDLDGAGCGCREVPVQGGLLLHGESGVVWGKDGQPGESIF
jgi:hypothetical protein